MKTLNKPIEFINKPKITITTNSLGGGKITEEFEIDNKILLKSKNVK